MGDKDIMVDTAEDEYTEADSSADESSASTEGAAEPEPAEAPAPEPEVDDGPVEGDTFAERLAEFMRSGFAADEQPAQRQQPQPQYPPQQFQQPQQFPQMYPNPPAQGPLPMGAPTQEEWITDPAAAYQKARQIEAQTEGRERQQIIQSINSMMTYFERREAAEAQRREMEYKQRVMAARDNAAQKLLKIHSEKFSRVPEYRTDPKVRGEVESVVSMFLRNAQEQAERGDPRAFDGIDHPMFSDLVMAWSMVRAGKKPYGSAPRAVQPKGAQTEAATPVKKQGKRITDKAVLRFIEKNYGGDEEAYLKDLDEFGSLEDDNA